MKFIYRKAQTDNQFALNMGDLKNFNLNELFAQLMLMSDGNTDQALDWLKQLGDQYGFINRDQSFEDLLDQLEKNDLIKRDQGDIKVTPTGQRNIRYQIFERVFKGLKKGLKGGHDTGDKGKGNELLPETRGYEFGDNLQHVNFNQSLQNHYKSLFNHSSLADFQRSTFQENELEVYEKEDLSSNASVLMIDISHSMILYGEDRITPAKMVAIALVEYVKRHYPDDTLDVITFGNEAKQVPAQQITEISIGPYHTNTCDGLKMAQSLLRKRRNANKQIFMITDGKPSAVFDRGRLYKNSFGLDPLVLSKTYAEARNCRKSNIRVSTFMIASDNYLVEFIEKFTQICAGQAFYTGLNQLGEFLFVDYASNRKQKL